MKICLGFSVEAQDGLVGGAHLRVIVDDVPGGLERKAAQLIEPLGGVNPDGKLAPAFVLAVRKCFDVLEFATGPSVQLKARSARVLEQAVFKRT